MAKIFVSYTSSDRDWAHWIANELQALGHTPYVHDWEIGPGGSIVTWMVNTVESSDHVLCVVSDEYLRAAYSVWEREAAQWAAARNRPGFALFVVVKPCRLPTMVDHVRRCELHGVPEDAARSLFRAFMTAPVAGGATAFPGSVVAVSNIPIRVPRQFVGRDAAMDAIEAAFRRRAGDVAVVALHGLRGVGKTTLAAAYAERHRTEYRATWWIRAQTEPTLRADLVGLGVRLGWVSADEKEDAALGTVAERLRHEGEGILLIFDNAIEADGVKPWLPLGGGARVLVTSNAYSWRGVAEPQEILVWPVSVGAEYLIGRTGRETEQEAAEALSETLGGMPLAHEQAAAYCEWLDVSLAEYARRFKASPTRLLDDPRSAPLEYHDRWTVAKTFALAIEEAAKAHPAAEPLMLHAALLAPEPIPLWLFAEGREALGQPLATLLDGDGLDVAVAALRSVGLINRERDQSDPAAVTGTIRLHRLVHMVAASRIEGSAREAARRGLIDALAVVYPGGVFIDPATWPRARLLDALTLALLVDDTAIPAGAEPAAASVLHQLAVYRYRALGIHQIARSLFERSLALREAAFGPQAPELVRTLSSLGFVLVKLGEYVTARPLLERALAICDSAVGNETIDTAEVLHDLAYLLMDIGEFDEAVPLNNRAQAIFDRILGPEHPDTIRALHNGGVLMRCKKDYAAAITVFERVLAIEEKVLGHDHPDVARTVDNLGRVVLLQGDPAAAETLFERARTVYEKALGPNHPWTAANLCNLGEARRDQGDLEAARVLLQRALAISEQTHGPDHVRTAEVRLHLDALNKPR